jgi:Kef-type K+ transport system membrane component KefB
MEPVSTLLAILICLALAYLFSDLSRMLGFPRLVGQVAAGAVLGLGVIKTFVFTQESLEILAFLSNLGILLLFYYVGLETNVSSFTKNIRKSILISIFNTLLPLIVGVWIMRSIFHLSNLASIIIGVCLAVSAQSVSVDILEELKLLRSKIGRLIITAGAVDDIIELILVSFLLYSFNFALSQVSPLKLVLDILIFIVVIVIARLWLVPYSLRFFDTEKSSTSRFMDSMIIVLLIAYLSDKLGVGSLIGAMIAGIIVRQTIFKDMKLPNWEEHDIAKSTHIIAFGFLIPLFFVSVGLNVDLLLIPHNIGMIALFLVIAILSTVLGSMIAIFLEKGSYREGLVIGWGLTPKGDVELVIAMLALTYGVITPNIFTSLIVMSLLTTIISSIVFKYLVFEYRAKKMMH